MRTALACLLLAAACPLARAAEVEFVRVWPEWRDAVAFERVSEYFTGQENTGSQVVRRTHPETRAGFYFLARVKNAGATRPSAKLVVTVIKPDSPRPLVYTFPVELPAGSTVFNLGLTGADWAGPKAHPVAWKVEVVATDGRLLAAQKSFLWEKPDK
jgi:hypothetical protein